MQYFDPNGIRTIVPPDNRSPTIFAESGQNFPHQFTNPDIRSPIQVLPRKSVPPDIRSPI